MSQNLIGRHRDRFDFFTSTAELPDLVLAQGGPLQEFMNPLSYRRCAGSENQRLAAGRDHAGQPDDGLSGAAGQHDDAVPSADVAILELREGEFEFIDNYENLRVGTHRLFPSDTVLGGRRVPRV